MGKAIYNESRAVVKSQAKIKLQLDLRQCREKL